jgi:hypothetical protein
MKRAAITKKLVEPLPPWGLLVQLPGKLALLWVSKSKFTGPRSYGPTETRLQWYPKSATVVTRLVGEGGLHPGGVWPGPAPTGNSANAYHDVQLVICNSLDIGIGRGPPGVGLSVVVVVTGGMLEELVIGLSPGLLQPASAVARMKRPTKNRWLDPSAHAFKGTNLRRSFPRKRSEPIP